MFGEEIDRGGAVSFAELERKEADRFSRFLIDVDNKLFTQHSISLSNSKDGQEEIRKYYSEGYEANHEGVDDKEIQQWQRAFPYIRAEGNTIGNGNCVADIQPFLFSENSAENSSEHVIGRINILPTLDEGLVIVGRSIRGTECAEMVVTECEEELLASHGTLQEYIEYNAVDNAEFSLNALSQSTLKPLESQRDEVVSSMVDAIWPDLVEAIKPLISAVLHAAKENNIPYNVDQNPVAPMNEYGEGGFDLASDDGW